MTGDVVPSIGGVEPITMRAQYELPWNRQSSQTACGDTVQNQNGDKGWRVVLEGVISKPQLVALNRLREQESVRVVTEELGSMKIAFDNLIITRRDENADGDFPGYQGPLLEFQLQTKEDSDDEEGIQFFNENTRGADYPSE